MKIYSDKLHLTDIVGATPAGCVINHIDELTRTRKRLFGWQVQLGRIGSNRPFNSGQFGTQFDTITHGTRECGQRHTSRVGAATYDDWGDFLASLYKLDPKMAAGPYQSAEHFDNLTGGKY